MESSLPIISAGYDVYKNIVGITHTFSKQWKYGLGVSIERTQLELLEQLVMAKNAPKPFKASYLIQASAKLEVLQLKMRLVLELELTSATRVFQVQAKLQEIGRMLGGWLKSTQGQ